MFNGFNYDIFIFIRQIFQNNRVDLFWFDFMIWFSIICKEFKRFYIKIFKKRIQKFPAIIQTLDVFQFTLEQLSQMFIISF